MTKNAFRAGAIVCALLLTACAPKTYSVRAPSPSDWAYAPAAAPTTESLSLVDRRTGADLTFSSGVLPAGLTQDGKPIDPPAFLRAHLARELQARGVKVDLDDRSDGMPRVELHSFRVQNHRVNGWSPFVTFTYVAADLTGGGEPQRLGVFIKRGKVPVWSFDEVVEPTFNEPLSLAVKELATKVANRLYGYRADEAAVDRLLTRLDGERKPTSYLDVYALGFTNHPMAVQPIAELTTDADEYVRLAAISSLGTLGATSEFGRLKQLYENRDSLWQDRAMALKSIADLPSDEAHAFVRAQRDYWAAQEETPESRWNLQIINLYL